MKLKIAPSEHVSLNWTQFGPNPGFSWTNVNGPNTTEQVVPLEGSAGHVGIGAPGKKIPGVCTAITMTDILVEFVAQEP